MRRLTLTCLTLTLLFSVTVFGQVKLPKTPVREVTEDYFGTKVTDPYRWLENTSDPEVVSWMKSQNDYTREQLGKIPGRDKLLDRIKSLDNAGAVVASLQVWGGHYFYLKTEPGSDNRKLYVRDTVSAPERLLVDPEKLTSADGKHFSIDYFQPSLDGKYVAYGISPGGSEDSVLHILETANGKALPDVIDRAQFGSPAWLPGNKSFFFTRTQKLSPSDPPTAKYQKLRVYVHSLGDDPEKDAQVFGYEFSPNVKVTEDDFPVLIYSPAAPKSMVGLVIHGVKNEKDVYVAPFSASPTANTVWTKVADDSEEITNLDVHGDDLFLLSHKDASRFKVLRTSLSKPELAKATLVVPPGEPVIINIAAAADGLYIQDLDGGIGKLRRLSYGSGKVESMKLPFDGAIQALVANPTDAGAWLNLVGWTKPPLWYVLNAKSGKVQDTHIVPPSPVDFSEIVSEEVKGKSAGGVTIGGAVTQRPDLFAAALIRVGDSDSLRSELMASGPANIPEFGTVKEADGFKGLYAMDAYQHVKADTAYPAVLLTTGVNDPRVAPWQAAKMTARLQASTNSSKPVLLRVDYDAGHGLGSTKSQRDVELADEVSFLFWQFGVPEFQPKQ